MVRICKHPGCALARSKTRVSGALCPECGFALHPVSSPIPYLVLPAIFAGLLFLLIPLCNPMETRIELPNPEYTAKRIKSPKSRDSIDPVSIQPIQIPERSNWKDLQARAEQLADAIPYQAAQSATDLARALARRGSTDEIRDPKLLAAVVYRWVASNISYDVASLEPTSRAPQDPDKVLHSRKAVCEGYSCLCEHLLNQNQVETRIIHGLARMGEDCIGRQLTVQENGHAWVAVKWDEKWHLLEPTWGAGSIESGRFSAHFSWECFDCDPPITIYSHIPEQDEMQLLQSPLSRTEIEQAACLNRDFFRALDMPPLPLVTGTIHQGSGADAIAWRIRPGYTIAAEVAFADGGGTQVANIVTLPSGVSELRFPGLPSGLYLLKVFAAEVGKKTHRHCAYFRLNQTGKSTAARPPVVFQSYHDLGIRLLSPLAGDLTVGGWQRFAIQADPELTFGLQFDGETTMHYLSSNQGVYENRLILRQGKLRLWQVVNRKMNCLAEFDVR